MFGRPRLAPFAVSLFAHGLILAWVASGPVYEKPKSLYEIAIAPQSHKLVWYDFREKLPDVSPTAARRHARPPRADVKIASQEIVAVAPKAPRARQFIWQPAPKLQLHADLKSPNVLAMHAPRPQPPPAPPKPKLFVPPPEAPKPSPIVPTLAAPPEIQTARSLNGAGNLLGAQPVKAPPRRFVAPRAGRPAGRPTPALPEAPAVAAATPTMAVPAPLAGVAAKAPPRDFVAPRQNSKASPFGSPLADAPAIPESASPSAVSMAIVGLNPAPHAPAPAPEGSRNAQFSAGPQPRGTGSTDSSAEGALLTVPGLLVRSGAADDKPTRMARMPPTSAANLRAAVHASLPAPTIAGAHPAAVRVSSAPDALWSGRDTYAMSVQMPNITSYSGSWMIWFSERREDSPAGGVLSPPVPLRKVDPKYYPAAMADGIEGTVRLAAVIRKDGRVDTVKLLRHLDDRLDLSAQDAIRKWEFEPALHDGQPVDVDAVVEIPFHLAPKVTK